METDKAIRLLALHAVQEDTFDFRTRQLQRWYSTTYFTPLTAVEELPLEYLLQHFYETRYFSMDEPDLEKERMLITETAAEHMERLRLEAEEAASNDAFVKQVEEEIKKRELKDMDLKKELDAKGNRLKLNSRGELPEVSLTRNKPQLQPDVNYKFLPDEDMARLIAEIDAENLRKGTKK